MFRFHVNCGSHIEFSEDCRTAERVSAKSEFNNCVVFSDKKLESNVIFQVRIDKRVHVLSDRIGIWSGGIEVGVTTLNPDTLTPDNFPQSATELRNGTWLMSSRTILQDGETLIENYGSDLEKLEDGDTVGLMRTNQGELVFFINKTPQGVAVPFVPPDIFAVVSLYGKCARVSLVDVEVSEQSSNTVELVVINEDEGSNNYTSMENNSDNDKLRFHSRCGPLVKLSCNNRTAERKRPKDEFNNAIVLTHRPLRYDELFQIRIDMLVRKWSGSIEFGLTSHNPATFDFPATLTIMQTGTLIMSGNGILHDGKAANSPYTNFNLDQLQEGDRVGVMRKSSGEICYFINGTNLGIAISGIHHQVWGAINLYGMAAKVTIVDRNEREEHNLRINVRSHQDFYRSEPPDDCCLLFHPNCGFHAAVINGGRTAHRPNSTDQFNHGVVLTSRTLKSNEIFEVRLDKMVTKWAGSIEIGVTTHVPTQLDYPCTMTNVRSGTWMMTGNGIMHNGTSIVDDYGQSLDRLKVGDRVGVVRKENGFLSFLINGEDQGCAATNVPENVYGVIDLYGQAAQVSIVFPSSSENNRSNGDNFCNNMDVDNIGHSSNNCLMLNSNSEILFGGDLRFHYLHGRNAKVSNNGLTASRPNALGEFNAAIVTSSRPLRDNEVFEVVIERMVDRWSGNIEAGVTTIRPEELVFPNTMTDIDHAETWMLSGSSIMMGGSTVPNRYNCNLDTLTVGSRVGIQRKSDGTLHYWINGEDQGVAAYDIPSQVFSVIDLYGQCAQVSITKLGDMSMISSQIVDSMSLPLANDLNHRFSACCGKNVLLKNNNLTAARVRHYTNALVFSSIPLENDEVFEIRLTESRNKWAGSVMVGVTSLAISDEYPILHLPPSITGICADTWYVSGSQVRKNQTVIKENYCVNLNRLSQGDRIGLRITMDGTLKLLINGEDMGVAAQNLPKKMHVVVDLYGSTEAISITSIGKTILSPNDGNPSDSSVSIPDNPSPINFQISKSYDELSSAGASFNVKHGKNIELLNENTTARRNSSYSQGIVVCNQVLEKNQLFQVKISKINTKWTSSIMIGVIDCLVDKISFPPSGLGFKKSCWTICGDCVFKNGIKVKGKYGPNLDGLQDGNQVGVKIDSQDHLHLYVNGVDQGIAGKLSVGRWRVFVDVYGQCEEVTVWNGDDEPSKKESNREDNVEKFESSTEKNTKLIEGNAIKNCEYFNSCQFFKNSLCLPDPYFVPADGALCYCESCHKIRGDQLSYKQGDPSADYQTPVGWVKFPVNISVESGLQTSQGGNLMTSSTSSLSNVLTTWHVAYHGLKIPHVRRVMDCGQLCADNGFTSYNYLVSKPKGKDEKTDGAILIFSPTIEYASIPEFSKRYEHFDPITKRKMRSKVAFQLLVQPGSYKKGPPSYPSPISNLSGTNCSQSLDYEAIEWSTKERGSTHVSALLVRLEPMV